MSLHGYVEIRRRARPVLSKPASLFRFLAGNGGLRPHGDLAHILDGNPFVPGAGPLIRAKGKSLDHAREACVEAGYLQDPGEHTGNVSESTERDLLELIECEARGWKQYPHSWSDCAEYDAVQEAHYRAQEALAQEGGEAVGAASPCHRGSTDARKDTRGARGNGGGSTMKGRQYEKACQAVGLSIYASAKFFGISLRQAQRIAAGDYELSEGSAKLLRLMVKQGLKHTDVT